MTVDAGLVEIRARHLVQTAMHELGHAVLADFDSWPIIYLTIVPSETFAGQTIVGAGPEQLSSDERAYSHATFSQAGDIAARLLQVTPELLALAAAEPDVPDAVARLAPEDAEHVLASRIASKPSDSERNAVIAEHSDFADAVVRSARERAWRHVTTYYPLLLALLPALLRARSWTGADYDAAVDQAAAGLPAFTHKEG